MYAPVLLPEAPIPSPQVLAAERRILDAEGPYHVDGLYYACEPDASRQRRSAAERLVREAARQPAYEGRATRNVAGGEAAAAPVVVTWLTSRERAQLDAAKPDTVHARHRSSVRELRNDVETGQAAAALVSAALVNTRDARELGGLVRCCPTAPVIALVSDADEAQALASALLLGRAGVECLIDCRRADGWRSLRQALTADRVRDGFMRDALATVLGDLGATTDECAEGCVRFFAAIFEPRTGNAKTIASRLGVLPTTLTSRFYRAGLPSPKVFATYARLVWAAHLAESAGLSQRAISYRLGASSPQSFGRSVRTFTGMTATEFRRAFTGRAMLDDFRARFIAPHREALRRFDPLHEAPNGGRPRAAASVMGPSTRNSDVGRAA